MLLWVSESNTHFTFWLFFFHLGSHYYFCQSEEVSLRISFFFFTVTVLLLQVQLPRYKKLLKIQWLACRKPQYYHWELPGKLPSWRRCWCLLHRHGSPETLCLGSSMSFSWDEPWTEHTQIHCSLKTLSTTLYSLSYYCVVTKSYLSMLRSSLHCSFNWGSSSSFDCLTVMPLANTVSTRNLQGWGTWIDYQYLYQWSPTVLSLEMEKKKPK